MEEVNKHSRDRFSIRHRCENQTIDSMSIAVQQYPFCQFTHLTLLTSSMCCLRRSHYAIKKRYNQRTIMKKGAYSFEPRGRYITLSSIKLQISVSTLCIPSHTLSTKHQGQISAHIHSSPPSPINLKSLLRNLNLLFRHSHLPTPIPLTACLRSKGCTHVFLLQNFRGEDFIFTMCNKKCWKVFCSVVD
jgi:hypothetical protein